MRTSYKDYLRKHNMNVLHTGNSPSPENHKDRRPKAILHLLQNIFANITAIFDLESLA